MDIKKKQWLTQNNTLNNRSYNNEQDDYNFASKYNNMQIEIVQDDGVEEDGDTEQDISEQFIDMRENCDPYEEFNQVLLANRWKVGAHIGTGSFGDVYRAYDTKLKRYVAIKKESRETRTLQRELEILKQLKMNNQTLLYSRYVDAHVDTYGHKYIIMDLLGQNLSDLHKACGGTFTSPTLCKIAIEIISRFEELHDQGIVHRDVKPQNFLIGRHTGDQNVYLCDFGLSARYINEKGEHILFATGIKPIGTARYASMRVHRGYERSRRDDFEALAYMLLYLNNGSLPWQGLKLKSRAHKWKAILQVKEQLVIEDVCKTAPYIFGDFVVYCRTMRFHQRPRYSYWKKRFQQTLDEVHDPSTVFLYDWERVLNN